MTSPPSPDAWLADFSERDPAAGATTESDGEASVSVAPTGALVGLTIEAAAWQGSGEAEQHDDDDFATERVSAVKTAGRQSAE